MHFVSTFKAVHEYVQYSASGKRGRKRVIGSLLWSLEREREVKVTQMGFPGGSAGKESACNA